MNIFHRYLLEKKYKITKKVMHIKDFIKSIDGFNSKQKKYHLSSKISDSIFFSSKISFSI
jgi:hypothetical protein